MSTGRNKHNLACLNKLNFGNKDCRNRSQILIKAQIQIWCYLQYRNNFNKNYTLFFRVRFICCYLAIKRSTLDLTKGSKCSQNVPCKCLNEASYFWEYLNANHPSLPVKLLTKVQIIWITAKVISNWNWSLEALLFRNWCLNYNRYDCALVFYKRSVKRKVKYEERELLKLSLKSELNLTHPIYE